MQTETSDWTATVVALDRASLDKQLESAVETAKAVAMQEGCRGILVTRQSHSTFIIELSHGVPYGQTQERYS
jgi:hypothetical protein